MASQASDAPGSSGGTLNAHHVVPAAQSPAAESLSSPPLRGALQLRATPAAAMPPAVGLVLTQPEQFDRAHSAPPGMRQVPWQQRPLLAAPLPLPLPAAVPPGPDLEGPEFSSALLGLLLADPPLAPLEQHPHAALLDGLDSLAADPGLDAALVSAVRACCLVQPSLPAHDCS